MMRIRPFGLEVGDQYEAKTPDSKPSKKGNGAWAFAEKTKGHPDKTTGRSQPLQLTFQWRTMP
jgi:hypothetical protein